MKVYELSDIWCKLEKGLPTHAPEPIPKTAGKKFKVNEAIQNIYTNDNV